MYSAFCKKTVLFGQDRIGLFQKIVDEFSVGRITRIDHNDKLLDFFDLPALHRLNERHISVKSQSINIIIQVKLIGIRMQFLPQNGKFTQKICITLSALLCLQLYSKNFFSILCLIPSGFLFHARLPCNFIPLFSGVLIYGIFLFLLRPVTMVVRVKFLLQCDQFCRLSAT